MNVLIGIFVTILFAAGMELWDHLKKSVQDEAAVSSGAIADPGIKEEASPSPDTIADPATQDERETPAGDRNCTYEIDDFGIFKDKKIEDEVSCKVSWFYVHECLYYARMHVKELELYREKINEIYSALAQEDAERVINAMFFDIEEELRPDPLAEKLERYWIKDHEVSYKPLMTTEKMKASARKLYQEKGLAGLKVRAEQKVEFYRESDFKSKSMDDVIQEAKNEANRIETIINTNPLPVAQQLLSGLGTWRVIQRIRKDIIKVDYGIDVKPPALRRFGIFD